MKRKREESVVVRPKQTASAAAPPRNMMTTLLDHDVLAAILSFCNVVDIFSFYRTCTVFRQGARLVVSRADSLHFSFLAASSRSMKTNGNQTTDKIVARMLEDASLSLKRLEVVEMSAISGQVWLPNTLRYCRNLTSLNLDGCSRLDPRVLETAVRSSGANRMIHINLTCCRRVDSEAIMAIIEKWRNTLQTLQLTGCSQTVSYKCLMACRDICNLRTLAFSGFKHIRDGRGLCSLSSSLESLSLSGCDKIIDGGLSLTSDSLLQALRQHLNEGNLREVAERVKMGNMDAAWTMMCSTLSDQIKQQMHRYRDIPLLEVFRSGWPNLRTLNVSNCRRILDGGPNGSSLGVLSFLSGGSLRQVDISGCEVVTDEDITMLAVTCHNSLTYLAARACRIGDNALIAVGRECPNLASLDVSACFGISDEGVTALCPRNVNGTFMHGCPGVRSLKLGSLPNLTDDAIVSIAGGSGDTSPSEYGLKKLLLLDVRDSKNVSSEAVQQVLTDLPLLVEVDARDISGKVSRASLPRTLRFYNGRSLGWDTKPYCSRSCSAMQHSQRLKASQGIRLQPMYHCVDCQLLPSDNLGMCSVCASVCHEGHETFFGSMARFYCDCAYGVAGGGEDEGCKALIPQDSNES